MRKMRALLALRSDIYGAGVATVVSREHNISVVASCSNYTDAEKKAIELRPDIVLMDSEILGGDCAQTIRSICGRLPNTKVIMLTHSTESEDLLNAFKAGACGYVTKYISASDLIRTVTLAYDGEAIIDGSLAGKLFAEFSAVEARGPQPSTQFDILTKRELEVLGLVASGATNKEIAESLFISEHTVKVHLRNIMSKLHIHNRQQATAMCIQNSRKPQKILGVGSELKAD